RPAFPRLAVPPHGEIRRLRRLYAVDRVEHDHPRHDVHGVVAKMAARRIRAPDLERRGPHAFCSSMICFSSAGIGGSGSRRICIEPSDALRVTMLNVANSGFFPG